MTVSKHWIVSKHILLMYLGGPTVLYIGQTYIGAARISLRLCYFVSGTLQLFVFVQMCKLCVVFTYSCIVSLNKETFLDRYRNSVEGTSRTRELHCLRFLNKIDFAAVEAKSVYLFPYIQHVLEPTVQTETFWNGKASGLLTPYFYRQYLCHYYLKYRNI